MGELSSGTASKDISIGIVNDMMVYEGNETFTVQLRTPTGAVGDSFALEAQSSTVVTITENDASAYCLCLDSGYDGRVGVWCCYRGDGDGYGDGQCEPG